MSAADTLDGQAGADKVDIFTDGSTFNLAQLTSIETANIYDLDAAQNIAANNFSSVTTVNLVRGDGTQDLTVGENVETIGVSDMDIAAGDLDLTLDAAATAITLNLADLTGGTGDNVDLAGDALDSVTANVTADSTFGTLDVAGASAITINATGDLELVDDVTTSDAAATMTVTGAGAADLGTLDNGVTTFVATDNTGGVTLTGPADSADASITLSTGDDTFTTDDDGFNADDEFAVDGGAGADTLVVAAAADISTSDEGGRYTNFETMRVGDFDQNVGLVSGISALEVLANTGRTYSNLSADAAKNITFKADNTTSTTFTLASNTAADAYTFNLASDTSTTNVDAVGVGVADAETVNIVASTGTDGTQSDFGFLADGADNVTAVNLSGSADVQLNQVADTFDVNAVTIDASALTGTGDFELDGGVLLSGSSVTGSSNGDTIALSSTTGVTYDGGAGDDSFTGSVADLAATGSDDSSIDGGAGTDTVSIDDAAPTITDNIFTNLSNVEKLVTTGTGDTSVTTGAAFNTAFGSAATVETGTLADGNSATISAGLATGDLTVTVDGGSLVGDGAGEDVTVTTGSGADTVTVSTDDTWVGAAGDGGSVSISTAAGADSIEFGHGTLTGQTTSQAFTIDAGAGADTIEKTEGTNGTTVEAVTKFTIEDGDSTATARDTIEGIDLTVDVGDLLGDVLDFDATSVVADTTGTNGSDAGSLSSHAISDGIITFDDAATFNEAVTIDSSNLSDALDYAAANFTTAGETVAFAYDSDDDGTNDATIAFNQGAEDSVVELAGVVAAGVSDTATFSSADDYLIIG